MSGTYPEQAYLDNGQEAQADRIYDNVQLILPNVLAETVKMETWNTIQDFCIRSTYFRAEVYWTMQVGQQLLDFNPFNGSMTAFQVLGLTGLPYYRVEPPALLINTGDNSTVNTGWALLALKPYEVGDIPPILFDLWFDGILDGVIARLAAHPAKPYSSPRVAAERNASYRSWVRRARDQAERFNSPQQPAWRFPYFARGVLKR